ncbi:MAG: entericidin [Alphaproteobacteria bacterium]|nr:entericidin [Alphaproteobacteria bacterium]
MKNIAFLTAFILLSSFSLSSCANTADGLGQDMEQAGQNIQKTF